MNQGGARSKRVVATLSKSILTIVALIQNHYRHAISKRFILEFFKAICFVKHSLFLQPY
jgi:hypothetical protein